MYERFTDRSRKVIQLANQEAQRFNHEYIGTEHILLGLIKEGNGFAATLLKNLDIDLRKVRLEVEKIVQAGPDMVTMGRLPQTPRAKKVIELAIAAARQLDQNHVGTEHILIGLVTEKGGVAYQVLTGLGATEGVVMAELELLLKTSKTSFDPSKDRPELGKLKEQIEELDILKEQAVCDQDFERASKLRDEGMKLRAQKRKQQEDTEVYSSEKLKKIACALLLNYTGDWSATDTVNEIKQILNS